MNIRINEEKRQHLEGRIVLIKYGGNAMVMDKYKRQVIEDVCELHELGILPVLVHGGGPAIKSLLEKVGIHSEFIGGHRKTDREAMSYVEMALSGQVNNEVVKLINNNGFKAVGLSGKDGGMVKADKRVHEFEVNGRMQRVDLGHVGNVRKIDTSLVRLLLSNGYIPVIAPIGVGEDLEDYNINADMFAGHMAGALQAEAYVVLTDVDGLMTDKNDPGTLLHEITVSETGNQMGKIIQGGMIPKTESCLIALSEGVKNAYIINGMKPHTITQQLLTHEPKGTRIKQD